MIIMTPEMTNRGYKKLDEAPFGVELVLLHVYKRGKIAPVSGTDQDL